MIMITNNELKLITGLIDIIQKNNNNFNNNDIELLKGIKRIINASDEKIVEWITIRGNHIPIFEGQEKSKVIEEFINKQRDDYSDSVKINWNNPEKSKFQDSVHGKSKSRYYNNQKYRDWDFDIRVSDHNKALKGSGQWPDDNYRILDFNGIKVKIDEDFYTGNDLDIVVDSIGDFNKIKKELNKYLEKEIPKIYEEELHKKMPKLYT